MTDDKRSNVRTAGTPATAEQLEQLATNFLIAHGERLLAVAKKMREQGITTVSPQHWKTTSRGLERLAKYIADAEQQVKMASEPSVSSLFGPGTSQKTSRR